MRTKEYQPRATSDYQRGFEHGLLLGAGVVLVLFTVLLVIVLFL